MNRWLFSGFISDMLPMKEAVKGLKTKMIFGGKSSRRKNQ